jgi:hypothetical protein
MRRFAAFMLSLGLLVGLSSVLAAAQPVNASRHAVADVRAVNKVVTSAQWTTLLSTSIKKPGKKDLFLMVSLECGLFTGSAAEPFADAAVVVRTLVDGAETRPGVVSYCGKSNGLMPPFTGLATCSSSSLSSCGFSSADRAEITRSLRSHHFNFLLLDLPKDIHTVTVQARVMKGSAVGPAFGVVGKGSLEVLVENLKNR